MQNFSSQLYQLHGTAYSMQGGRVENQDDIGFMDTPLGYLLVICDGMGGGPGGKTASYVAKQAIIKTMLSCKPQMQRESALRQAVENANEELLLKIKECPALKGMGTTVVAILINRESAVVAHVGDSRCYRLSKKDLKFKTNNHSLVGELVQNGIITEEQARLSPQSSTITRYLGSNSHAPEVNELAFKQGDRFVLCTDGAWGALPQPVFLQRLTSPSPIQAIAQNLSSETDKIGLSHGGHHDNHTLAIIEMDTNSNLKDKMDKKNKILLIIIGCVLFFSLFFNIMSLISLHKERKSYEKLNQMIDSIYSTNYGEQTKPFIDNGDNSKSANIIIQGFVNQRDSLVDVIKRLNHEIDSLKKDRKESSSNMTNPKDASNFSFFSLTDSITTIINIFNKMKDCTGKLEKIKGQEREYCQSIKATLSFIEKNNVTSPNLQKLRNNIDGYMRKLTSLINSKTMTKWIDENLIDVAKKWKESLNK